MRECDDHLLAEAQFSLPLGLHWHAGRIQARGLDEFGPEFRYIGYDLAQLTYSRGEERWVDGKGGIRFVARPYLGCHTLILSAHLSAECRCETSR